MANPQKENGFTPIANEIMEALGRFRIPGEERQVLDVILRQTYGWNKTEDNISLSQFVEKTGMKKSNISAAIKRLLCKHIIIMSLDNHRKYLYKINKDYEKWVHLYVKPLKLCKGITGVMKTHNKSLCKDSTTKEKKETITKESIVAPKIILEEGKFKNIPGALIEKWKQVAPGVDISAEIKKAELWIMSNPEKKRSKWTAFLSNWMIRAQDHFIKYGGRDGKGIRTNRSDPRDQNLQSREDAEINKITAKWEAAKEAARNKATGDAGNDDAPNFEGEPP